MRICVYGAGAIGGYLAGSLARGGHEVSVVVRGAHLAAIRDHGLVVDVAGDGFTTHPRATDDPATLGVQDAVLVTAKAPSLPAIAAGLPPLLGPRTRVAFLTNGIPWWYFQRHGGKLDGRRIPLLDPEDRLLNAVGESRILGGIFWPASSVPEPGHIRLTHPGRGTVFGAPDGVETPEIAALAEAFRTAQLPVTVSATIRDLIWEKLAFNLSAGPMCVLTRTPVRATQEEPACVAASRALLAEAAALIQALGRKVELDVERIVATNQQLGHRPSILQDLLARRPMEIDALYTVPLEMARDAGVPMPTLALLVGLIKAAARGEGLYAPTRG